MRRLLEDHDFNSSHSAFGDQDATLLLPQMGSLARKKAISAFLSTDLAALPSPRTTRRSPSSFAIVVKNGEVDHSIPRHKRRVFELLGSGYASPEMNSLEARDLIREATARAKTDFLEMENGHVKAFKTKIPQPDMPDQPEDLRIGTHGPRRTSFEAQYVTQKEEDETNMAREANYKAHENSLAPDPDHKPFDEAARAKEKAAEASQMDEADRVAQQEEEASHSRNNVDASSHKEEGYTREQLAASPEKDGLTGKITPDEELTPTAPADLNARQATPESETQAGV